MKVLKSLYWNTYYELKTGGKSTESARKTGTLLVALALLLNTVVVLALLNGLFPDIGEFIEDSIKAVFGRKRGRSIGRILGLFSLVFFYVPVALTWGSKAGYARLIDQFNALNPTEQKQASKQGLPYFIGTFISFFIVLFLFLMDII